MSDSFVSLHTHTSYSQLDGASKIPELVARAKELGMPALGISDHGNLNGIIDFYRECKAQDIKPVLGQEFYFADDRLVKETVKQENENGEIDGSDKRYYHLSVWAENDDGYRNLLKLSSDAFLNGMYYKPRTDYEMLEQHSKGLFVGSGCLGGPVLQKLLHNEYNGALVVAATLQDIIGKDNFFIEMMNHGLPEQHKTNAFLIEIAKELDAPLICTQDTHYTHRHDAKAHDALLCCQVGAKISDEKRFKFHNDEYYLKSSAEMRRIFSETPSACDNTLLIAERTSVDIDFDSIHLPDFPVPDGYEDDYAMLEELTMEGLKKRYGDNPDQSIYERAAYELGVIRTMNLSSYFLIFWDLVEFANRERIFTGPGRGSAAGCIVSYALGITKVDPVKHDLIFERFINPERIALADIDWDIDTRFRDKLINYTREKYGSDRVAQIVTFTTIKARTAARDAARVLDYEWNLGDKIAKAMPPLIMGVDTPLYACFEPEPKYEAGYKNAQGVRDMYQNDPKAKEIIDTALGLEGLVRQDGVHAAAVVIGDRPLDELVPLQQRKDKPIVTQWEKNTIEDLGLLKMDFLGLRNLDVISDTLARLDLPFDYLEKISLEDPKTFKLLQDAKAIGVFQVESPQMRELLSRLKPTTIEDISAVLALFRPGPMSTNMHYDYADRKNGRQASIPFHEDAKDILAETFQLAVYQEQIMKLSRKFAGYTFAEADNLRKIMGKKLPDKMKLEKSKFVQGCLNSGYDKEFSEKLFVMIEGFSNYGFNKSHSLAYGYITYWTAWLKANHPLEYMASICSSVMGDLEKTAVYLYEVRRMGWNIYPPDVNLVETNYSVEKDGIRIGLNTLRHIGENAAADIIKERNDNGKFKSLYDFAKRINPNVQALKSLAYSGALDEFGTRLGVSAVAEDVLKSARKEIKKISKDQTALFDSVQEGYVKFDIPTTEFSWGQFLAKERDSLGIYASGHPLDDYENLKTDLSVADLKELEPGKEKFEVLVMVSDVKVKYTKAGDAMATANVEDQTGSIELVLFPKKWKDLKHEISEGKIVQVKLRINRDFRDEINYIADTVESVFSEERVVVDEIFGVYVPKKFHTDPHRMSKLKGVLLSHSGNVPVKVYTSRSSTLKLDHDYLVEPTRELKRDIVDLFKAYNKERK